MPLAVTENSALPPIPAPAPAGCAVICGAVPPIRKYLIAFPTLTISSVPSREMRIRTLFFTVVPVAELKNVPKSYRVVSVRVVVS